MKNETNADCNSMPLDDEELFARMNRSMIEQSLPSAFLEAILKAAKSENDNSKPADLGERHAMKLWLLKPVEPCPWEGRYDVTFGFVVRAETEHRARMWAEFARGDEAHFGSKNGVWTDSSITTCTELTGEGKEGVVMRDFNAG